MARFLALVTLALAPALASAEDKLPREYENHVAKKVEIRAYDPVHHDLVVIIDHAEVVIQTHKATVHGQLQPGRLVDVSWEGDRVATSIVVRPDRLRAITRP